MDNDMTKVVEEFYESQEAINYENGHRKRFDFLVEDLGLGDLKDSKILDVGCGMGFIFKRMSKNKGNTFVGIDGFKNDTKDFIFRMKNLDNPYAEDLVTEFGRFDFAFMFEVCEHISNPYSALFELKSTLKPDGILYLSIPATSVQHNTLYPGLLYPVENFKEFLVQMAFEIVDERFHDKRFQQHVFILKNKDWTHTRMRWPKGVADWNNKPPHYRINQ